MTASPAARTRSLAPPADALHDICGNAALDTAAAHEVLLVLRDGLCITGVARTACNLLARHALAGTREAGALCVWGAPELVLRVLRKHRPDTEVVCEALLTLGALATASPPRRADMARLHAVDTVLALIHFHATNRDVILHGWLAIGQVIEGDAESAQVFLANDAVETLLFHMDALRESKPAMLSASGILMAVMELVSKPHLPIRKCFDTFQRVLATPGTDFEIVLRLTLLTTRMALYSEDVVFVMKAAILGLRALSNHRTNADGAARSVRSLCSLMKKGGDIRTMLKMEGVEAVLRELAETYPDNTSLIEAIEDMQCGLK